MTSPTASGTRASRLKRWAPLAAIVLITALGVQQGWHEQLSLSALIRHQDALAAFIAENRALSLLTYGVVYAVAVAVSFPGASFMTIAAGFLFGWLAGGLVTIVAATLGAVALFLAVRTSLGAALRERAGPFMTQLAAGFREDAVSYLLFLRLTPVFPFWLVNIAPALFHVPLRVYAITTLVGIIPGTFAYSVFGSGLGSVIEAQKAANPGCAEAGTCSVDLSAIVTTEMVVALVALGLVALIPVALKAWRRRGAPSSASNGS
ncbi:MAG: TVP38/TMEM64 family protein [Hyphomicrobiales bacterium]|nr:MAG: TVP38/TMEM64 family protein [Hyphomicrobiales bacterium]